MTNPDKYINLNNSLRHLFVKLAFVEEMNPSYPSLTPLSTLPTTQTHKIPHEKEARSRTPVSIVHSYQV